MVRVKICGNTDRQQIDWAVEAGADCLGFVVEYPVAVPWNLSRDEARELLGRVPPMVSRAVVTGGEPEHVLAIARSVMPHFVQLHTDNSLDETSAVANKLAPLGIGLIRALRIDVATGEACGEIADPIRAALALQETGIAGLLLDARTSTMPAGTGTSVDWQTARSIREALSIPMVLAGGLTPQNVRRAIETVRPFAVDVISGVEAARKVKDPELIRAFIAESLAAG